MMDNMIEVRDLQVTLSGKTIVQHMNAEIPNGKITAIIGPNGCGKSTTLKAICRINPISAGQITLLNRNVWDFGYKEFAQKLAILTQSPQAPADMTVRDLVAMGRFPYRSLFGKWLPWVVSPTAVSSARQQRKIRSVLSGRWRKPA